MKERLIKIEILSVYKTMPEYHKNNLKSYFIYKGIFDCYPDIDEKDAQFIYKITLKVENENINPYSISHYLTDHYTRGNLTKKDLENATSGEISEAVFYDSLDYFSALEVDENEKYY